MGRRGGPPVDLAFARDKLLQPGKELFPAGMGAAKGLFLFRPEARLLYAQMSSLCRRGEGEGHDAREIVGGILMRKIPRVGERPVRLDGKDLAVEDAAPVAAKIEAVADAELEIILHQPVR